MSTLRWVTATLGLCLPAAAFAQTPPPPPPEEPKMIGLRLEGGFIFASGLGITIPADTAAGLPDPVVLNSEGNLRVGYDFPGGITALLGLGFGSSSASQTQTPTAGPAFTESHSITEWVLSLQGRYYARPHRALSPYGFLELQKSFVSGSVSSNQLGFDVAAAQKAIDERLKDADHWGVLGGAGAEYLFAPGFGFGGQWGLGAFFRSASHDNPSPGLSKTSESATQVATIAQLYATFRF